MDGDVCGRGFHVFFWMLCVSAIRKTCFRGIRKKGNAIAKAHPFRARVCLDEFDTFRGESGLGRRKSPQRGNIFLFLTKSCKNAMLKIEESKNKERK